MKLKQIYGDRYREARKISADKAQEVVNDAFFYAEKRIHGILEKGQRQIRIQTEYLGTETYYFTPGSVAADVPGVGMKEPPKATHMSRDIRRVLEIADSLLNDEIKLAESKWRRMALFDFIDLKCASQRLTGCLLMATQYLEDADEGYDGGYRTIYSYTVDEFLKYFRTKDSFKQVPGVGDKLADEMDNILRSEGYVEW